MCPPTYYGIEYEINPWMSRSQQSNPQQAQKQWDALRRLLVEELSVEVGLVESQPKLPDMVFTANAGLVWKKKFISSNFRYEVRRGESSHFEKWFGDQGFEIIRLPENYHFEGEGDLLKCGERWFAGYHIRSDINAHQRVADIIEQEVLSLELTDDWFYHLDTCFCPCSESVAFFYPPAFDPYARKVLADNIPQLIPVGFDEASRFACNAIVAGKSVAMNDGCPKIRGELESLGFDVFETPLSEFLKAGGSAKCLVLIITSG
ncbi:MAG: dimethylarginine dimethylaminohydrolase family protein [Candidatus Binatia bacterium]